MCQQIIIESGGINNAAEHINLVAYAAYSSLFNVFIGACQRLALLVITNGAEFGNIFFRKIASGTRRLPKVSDCSKQDSVLRVNK